MSLSVMRVMRTNPVRTDTREATWDISARDIKSDDKSIMANPKPTRR